MTAEKDTGSIHVQCTHCGHVFETHDVGDMAACERCDGKFSRFRNIVEPDDEPDDFLGTFAGAVEGELCDVSTCTYWPVEEQNGRHLCAKHLEERENL